MFRKLFTGFLSLSLVLIGLGQATSASADAGFSPTVTAPGDSYQGLTFPISDGRVLQFWVDNSGNETVLKSGNLNADGTFTNVADIASVPSGYIDFLTEGSVAMTADGVVAVTWISRHVPSNSNIFTARLNISYTYDGIEWSSPQSIWTESYDSQSRMCGIVVLCGLSNPKIAIDAFGVFGIVLTDSDESESFQVLATSSRDGANWAPLTELQNRSNSLNQLSLISLPAGGFIATWASHESNWKFKYSTMTGSILNYWNTAKEIGTYDAPLNKIVAQTSNTKVSLFIGTGTSNNYALHHRTFDLLTKTWSGDAILFSRDNWLQYGSLSFDPGKNGHSAVGFGLRENGATNGAAYLIEVNNSIPGQAQLVDSTSQEQGLYLSAISANPDGSVSVATNGQAILPRLKRFKAGVQLLDVVVPVADPNNQFIEFKGTASANGNMFFFSASGYTTRDSIVYVQAAAPTHSGTPAVRGTAKTGAKLTAGNLIFSSISGIGVTTRQWYACTREVPVNTTVKPSTCSAISKATGSTFKVTSKQKGKYITVAVKNSNPVGTATIFAPVSKKSK